MTLLASVLFVGVIGWVVGQPIPFVPNVSYQPFRLLYLNPQQQQLQSPSAAANNPQPILINRVSPYESNEEAVEEGSDEEQDNYEVSQFHSEDEHGRVVYGFHSPDQIRMEARDSDGTVRGSYSYIDAYGNIVKMHYWDDGNGFHAAGNNLPIAIHQAPEYTPEVKAAREQHFKLYEAALASLAAVSQSERNSEEEEQDGNDYADQQSFADPELDSPSEDTVIIENGVQNDNEDNSKTQMIYQIPFAGLSNQQLSDDKESVAIDNPELRSNILHWARKAKSQSKEINKEKSEPTMSESKVETKQTPGVVQTIPVMEKKIDLGTGIVNPLTKEITGGNRAFFYHFQHEIPVMKLKPDQPIESESSVSTRAKAHGAIPIAAVHDAQVSPLQRDSIPNVQLFPIYHHEDSDVKRD